MMNDVIAMKCQENPLINPPQLPHDVPALDRLRNEHFLPAIRHGIAQARARIEAIRHNPAPPTFENTLERLEYVDVELSLINGVFSNICSSNSNEELREIEEVVDVEMSNFHSDISLDEKLFVRIMAVYDQREKLALSNVQQRLLEETYKGFVRNGALLDAEGKARVRLINEELAKLTTQFGNNETKATEAYKKLIVDERELAGVPARAKNLYRHLAQEEGKEGFLITLEPFPIDIFTHCANRALREEVFRASAMRCYDGDFDNRQNILSIVKLKHERARLLGFPNHAAFVLANRMAGDIKTVQDFLENNLSVYKPAAEKELAAIRAFAKETDNIDDIKLWDVAYYTRLMKEKTLDFEVESLRPYFNLEKVLEGMRHHAEKLFSLEIKQETTGKYPVYHPDVITYEVFDQEKNELIGIFYADYYARPGAKRGGAWMSNFRDYIVVDSAVYLPLVTNNANFAKPTPTQPTFLSLEEVETVFHEFGHALHDLLSQAKYPSLSGRHVKWDFVELPSQVQENWILEKEVLDTFAHHHETGESIPAEMIEKIRKMKNFDAGMVGLKQTFFAMLDMAFFTKDIEKLEDIAVVEKEIAERADLIKRDFGSRAVTFSHIFSGAYSAGYYSYRWAEVLDADVFAAFKAKGLYDPDMSARLKKLYAAGDMQEPMALFESVMGRGPDPDALYRRAGLK